MAYNPPGTGLSGAKDRKVEASVRMKKSLNASRDHVADNLASLRREHKEAQDRLRRQYAAQQMAAMAKKEK